MKERNVKVPLGKTELVKASPFFKKKPSLFPNFFLNEVFSNANEKDHYFCPDKIDDSFKNTAPRGALKYRQNTVFRDPYILMRHTLGIIKIPTWKYSMCIQAKFFDISDLCTEKWHQIGLKRGFFSTKVLLVFFCTNELHKTYIMLPFQVQ